MARLAGKVALITGAGSGIGRATARLFAREGAKVGVADVNAARAETVTAEISDSGGEAIAIASDVSKGADCERMVAETVRALWQARCHVQQRRHQPDGFGA